jgi:hypothetical protein
MDMPLRTSTAVLRKTGQFNQAMPLLYVSALRPNTDLRWTSSDLSVQIVAWTSIPSGQALGMGRVESVAVIERPGLRENSQRDPRVVGRFVSSESCSREAKPIGWWRAKPTQHRSAASFICSGFRFYFAIPQLPHADAESNIKHDDRACRRISDAQCPSTNPESVNVWMC